MNLVDSSCWLEYFAGSLGSSRFVEPIENTSMLVVPTICIYEVFKKILLQRDEGVALQAIAHMRQGIVVDLTSEISLSAAAVSIHHKLPMADSIILATARIRKALVWTQDEHFSGIDGVKYFPKE